MIEQGKIVTVRLDDENVSNTYIISEILDDRCLLYHPLFPDCYITKNIADLDLVQATIKNSTERCLDFAMQHKEKLDYNTLADLEALCLYFVVRKKLTPKQKQSLSNMCGIMASIHFDNNIRRSMDYIMENNGVLDDFNRMWFNNFKGLFQGSQEITSKKQRASIFNIAGYVLAELNNPKASKPE